MSVNCPVSNKFKNTSFYNSFGNITEMEHNLMLFLQNGFWCTGAWIGITNSMDLGQLRQMDTTYCSGLTAETAYHSIMGGWVYDSSLVFTDEDNINHSPLPVQVYVSGVLQPSGSYSVDYQRGCVVFTSVPVGDVTAQYSLSLVNVLIADDTNWWVELESNSWDIDNFNFSQCSTNAWDFNKNRVNLPVIAIKTVSSTKLPWSLRDGMCNMKYKYEMVVDLYIYSEKKCDIDKFSDFITLQAFRRINTFDVKAAYHSGDYNPACPQNSLSYSNLLNTYGAGCVELHGISRTSSSIIRPNLRECVLRVNVSYITS